MGTETQRPSPGPQTSSISAHTHTHTFSLSYLFLIEIVFQWINSRGNFVTALEGNRCSRHKLLYHIRGQQAHPVATLTTFPLFIIYFFASSFSINFLLCYISDKLPLNSWTLIQAVEICRFHTERLRTTSLQIYSARGQTQQGKGRTLLKSLCMQTLFIQHISQIKSTLLFN